jgi:hypothetical protein
VMLKYLHVRTLVCFCSQPYYSRPKKKHRCNSYMWFFLTCREEKFVQFHAIIYSRQYLYAAYQCQKSLNWGGGQQFKVRISLHSVPMLKIVCPVSHKPPASPLPQALPLFLVKYTYTCETILLSENDIGTSEVFFIRHTPMSMCVLALKHVPGLSHLCLICLLR